MIEFRDAAINQWLAETTDKEFNKFIDNLREDSDEAIISRFELDSAQTLALAKTDSKMKDFLVGALEHFRDQREKLSGGSLTVKGFGEGSEPEPLDRWYIRCELKAEPPWIRCETGKE